MQQNANIGVGVGPWLQQQVVFIAAELRSHTVSERHAAMLEPGLSDPSDVGCFHAHSTVVAVVCPSSRRLQCLCGQSVTISLVLAARISVLSSLCCVFTVLCDSCRDLSLLSVNRLHIH